MMAFPSGKDMILPYYLQYLRREKGLPPIINANYNELSHGLFPLLYISSRSQVLCIVITKHGIGQRRCQIASPLTAFNDYLRNPSKRLDHVFGFTNVDKSDRSRNDTTRAGTLSTNQRT